MKRRVLPMASSLCWMWMLTCPCSAQVEAADMLNSDVMNWYMSANILRDDGLESQHIRIVRGESVHDKFIVPCTEVLLAQNRNPEACIDKGDYISQSMYVQHALHSFSAHQHS